MKISKIPFFLPLIALVFASIAAKTLVQAQAAPVTVNGSPAVILKRPDGKGQDKPRFVEATVLPGAGMNLLQLKAYLPGSGDVNVIGATSLADAKRLLEVDNDAFGNKSFTIGGAILMPFPNRMRGALSSDGKTLTTDIGGKQVRAGKFLYGIGEVAPGD